MKKEIMKISYKMLVISMLMVVLSFFCVSPMCEAKLKLEEGQYYYTGTQEAKYVVEASVWETVITSLGDAANAIVGFITLGLRGVIVGWTQIMEILLTRILSLSDDLGTVNENAMDSYTQEIVNVESILFNRVEILDANIFNTMETEEGEEISDGQQVVRIIRQSVAKWYYVLRLIVIAFMLILLIFVGIKMAISTIASEKAVYKQMLIDWVAGMIIVFAIHYIMIFILDVNNDLVKTLEPLAQKPVEKLEEYQYGDEPDEKTSADIETSLYESARTRAYSLKLTDGFTGMVIYAVLVYYAWKFALMYSKRVINIVILTLVAPAIAASYAFNKVLSGKAKIYSTWLQEYIMNVVMQLIHVIMYVSFVSIALTLSLQSVGGTIVAFVLLDFMTKAEKIIRKIFKLSGGKGSLAGDMADRSSFKDLKKDLQGMSTAMMGGKYTKMAAQATMRLATKPARAGAEYIFGKAMETLANDKTYTKNKEKEKEDELKEIEDEYDVFRNAKEKDKQWQEIQEERNALIEEQSKEIEKQKEREQAVVEAWNMQDEEALKNAMEQLENNKAPFEAKMAEIQQKLQENDQKIELFEDEELKAEEDFLKYYVSSRKPEDVIKKGLSAIFDYKKYTKKGEDGKYHAIKTKRDGTDSEKWYKRAFWRKKTDSIGMRFAENAKWEKVIGLSSKEKKILEKEAKFLKSTITGVVASMVGFPALAINPGLGMALLGQAALSRMEVATRRRMLKNRPAYKRDKSYRFVSFNDTAKATMQREAIHQIMLAEGKITRRNVRKHRKIAHKIIENTATVVGRPLSALSTVAFGVKFGGSYSGKIVDITTREEEQMERLYQKDLRKSFENARKQLVHMKAKDLRDEYKKEFGNYEKGLKDKIKLMSERELILHDKLSDENTIAVGDTLMTIETDSEAYEFVKEASKIEWKSDISRAQKITQITKELDKHKTALIEDSIAKVCAEKGITDITKLDLTGAENVEVKKKILANLEDRGIIKKGEITLDDELISDETIKKVHIKLTEDQDKANKKIEEKIVQDAVLEYIARENIKNPKELKKGDAKQEIYDIIKERLMSSASKDSAEVIRQLSGQDKLKDQFKLSDSMKQTVVETTKKVKKVHIKNDLSQDVDPISKYKKKKLFEREVNRQTNETKNKLEEAMFTENDDKIETMEEYRLKLVLSELAKQNIQAKKVGEKVKSNKKKEVQNHVRYYMNKDGSKIYNQDYDGNTDLSTLETKIYGPVADVISLINKVGK